MWNVCIFQNPHESHYAHALELVIERGTQRALLLLVAACGADLKNGGEVASSNYISSNCSECLHDLAL